MQVNFSGDQPNVQPLAIPDLSTFGVGVAFPTGANRRQANAASNAAPTRDEKSGQGFEALYSSAVGKVLHGDDGDIAHSLETTGTDAFEAMRIVRELNARPYVPAGGARYPRGRFGDSLRQIAQLIKADVGLEVAFTETGGWDTHANQGGAQGSLARNLAQFGEGLAALYTDLGGCCDSDHERVWPHGSAKRQQRHRSRPRHLLYGAGRRCQGR
jgi:uncharacterized protein (DUF1501 family)